MHSQIVLAIIRVHGLAYLCEVMDTRTCRGECFGRDGEHHMSPCRQHG